MGANAANVNSSRSVAAAAPAPTRLPEITWQKNPTASINPRKWADFTDPGCPGETLVASHSGKAAIAESSYP